MRLLEIKTEESCMIVNKNRTNSSNLRQWHPAFFADIQIELEAERENLIFENEHQLGTKPMEIDALVIKKKTDIPINKNIGRIFRKYNIIEYLRQEFPYLKTKMPTLWTNSYFVSTVGGAPLETVKQYIENQKTSQRQKDKMG